MLERFRQSLISDDDRADMAALESMFAEASDVQDEVAIQEKRLSNAFDFIEKAFGDAQEMLIFVTELTQRTPTERFIAQFGSESYFAHNQPMILSDSHRKLRSLVEELEL